MSDDPNRIVYPTLSDIPHPICFKCYGLSSELGLAFTRINIGDGADCFYDRCNGCMHCKIIKLVLFFSPASGSTLETQIEVLKFFYRNQLDIILASSRIHFDHEPDFKCVEPSSLNTRLVVDILKKEIVYGQMVAMDSGDHHIKTMLEQRISSKLESYQFLQLKEEETMEDQIRTRTIARNETTDVSMLYPFLEGIESIQDFIESGIWWGKLNVDGTRISEMQCITALRKRHDEILAKPGIESYMNFANKRVALFATSKRREDRTPREQQLVNMYYPDARLHTYAPTTRIRATTKLESPTSRDVFFGSVPSRQNRGLSKWYETVQIVEQEMNGVWDTHVIAKTHNILQKETKTAVRYGVYLDEMGQEVSSANGGFWYLATYREVREKTLIAFRECKARRENNSQTT